MEVTDSVSVSLPAEFVAVIVAVRVPLYSDEIEQENPEGEQYGEDRVAGLVDQYKDRPMAELMEAIYREVRTHRATAPQSDDVTVLLVKREP